MYIILLLIIATRRTFGTPFILAYTNPTAKQISLMKEADF